MLDDLKYIHQRDSQDALGVAEKQWQQLQYDYGVKATIERPVENIVVAGMGGSALAATYVKSWPGLNLPYEVVRDYELPAYVGENTLFVASSYSGNTEETVAALQAAQAVKAQIVIIASGGELAAQAETQNYPLYKVPAGLQPRMAVMYNLAALIQLFEAVGAIQLGSLEELRNTAEWLGEHARQNWLPTVPANQNQAKRIALELMGKSPVIYAGPKFYPVAYKWKINFNENAKNVAWCNQYPEFNHNEFMGWSSHPVDKPYAVIELRSLLEHPQVQKRFQISERLLSGQRPAAEVVLAEGESLLKQMLWATMLGDFVSLYLALLNGLDPTPVDLIEKLKVALKAD